jgi:ABC-type Fe3+ transport system substrate-binding protein
MTDTEGKKTPKILKNEYSLIKGDFAAEEASEIVNYLISKKINFHNQRNFSKEIRLGEPDEISKQRVNELMEIKKSINVLIKESQEAGKSLRILSTILIEII